MGRKLQPKILLQLPEFLRQWRPFWTGWFCKPTSHPSCKKGKNHSAWARASFARRKEAYGGKPCRISSGAHSSEHRPDSTDPKPDYPAAAVGEERSNGSSYKFSANSALAPAFVTCADQRTCNGSLSCESHRNATSNCSSYTKLGLLNSPLMQPPELQELEDEKLKVGQSTSQDPSGARPVASAHCPGEPNRLPECRPDVGAWIWKSWSQHARCPGESQAASRVSSAEGFLFLCSASIHGQTHAADSLSRGNTGTAVGSRSFWYSVSGALRWLWETSRVRMPHAPGDDDHGFSSGRKFASGAGLDSAPGGDLGSSGARQWKIRLSELVEPPRRTSFHDLLPQASQCVVKDQGVHTVGIAAMGHSSPGLHKRTRCHLGQETRARKQPEAKSIRLSLSRSTSYPKTKRGSEEKGKRRRKDSSTDGRGRGLIGSHCECDHQGADEEAKSNPLTAKISFHRWMTCLPRWVLKTRTGLAFCLSRSFAILHRSDEQSSALFPLPLYDLTCFASSGPGLSRRRFLSVCKSRIVNLWILILDHMFLGRWPSQDELRRCPSAAQTKIFDRLWTFLSACGDAQEEFSLCPGRSSPELASALLQLESFCSTCEDLKSGYMQKEEIPLTSDPELLPVSTFPELLPYRSLDASRLRLVGEGKWCMADYLDGALWLPYQEPAFLLHGLPVPDDACPNFAAEKPEECFKLAKLWDARGLLCLWDEPVAPDMFSRVFNAYKDRDRDRQIGDRRKVNLSECHLDGPSKFLPQGQLLTSLRVPRFTHCLKGSVTDRRDFYHQALVSQERARTNMLPFAYKLDDFAGTRAHDLFVLKNSERPQTDRKVIGDRLGFENTSSARRRKPCLPERVYPAFASLFQGDHLGVEFALRSHSLLLENFGLLKPETRLLGNSRVPSGPNWDALVIDDYFAISSQPLSLPESKCFAFSSLEVARRAYEREELLGSPEKDVICQTTFKAAGAEVRSHAKAVRSGVLPVGAPLAKRIALSCVSLRAACLSGRSSTLISRLAGNWVSILQFRKCWSSLIDGMFRLASKGHLDAAPIVRPLTRQVAQELVSLAVVAPLIFSNVAVGYLDQCFATDASVQKGAIVKTKVHPKVQEEFWLSADKRGAYTHLANDFRALLRQVGEVDDDLDLPGPVEPISPTKQPLCYFDFVEICGGAGKVTKAASDLGLSVAPVLDLSFSPHYDLCNPRFFEWLVYMLEEGRFRSFLIAPPCASFSPAAHPAVRSYKQPLGFDRRHPKVWLGNRLAFRSLALLRVAKRCFRPCGLEQSRLSKMCWLQLWRTLLDAGFEEAVLASCAFGSIHRKEFRFLCFLLDVEFLDTRCPGGHSHVKVEGAYTKASATYVDGLAWHVAIAFKKAIRGLEALKEFEPEVDGFEQVLSNDVMSASHWSTVRAWRWKRQGHINVLELASAVSNLASLANDGISSARFANFLDSAVCKGALTKGRSASYALQPGLKRTCAICVCADLYPCWPFSPTRLNVADDPSRDAQPRPPVRFSIVDGGGLEALAHVGSGLRRYAANWCRIVILAHMILPVDAVPDRFCVPLGFQLGPRPHDPTVFGIGSAAVLYLLCVSSGFLLLALLWRPCWIFFRGSLSSWLHFRVGYNNPPKRSRYGSPQRSRFFAMVILLCWFPGSAMQMAPQTEVERQRSDRRAGTILIATRAIKEQTRSRRRVYLAWFCKWLLDEKGISFRVLIERRPPDPEQISDLLVEYGKSLYRSGKAYGIFAETINSVAVERPLIRRQLVSAWDLAFQWLADEPHAHHPAMPLSVMTAMVTVAIHWGWPMEAAVILLGWTGVMRIGEVLASRRKDLVLPVDAAPGTSFMLIVVNQPKTRGRAAKHQAARVDQADVIRFITSLYRDAPAGSAVWPFSAATLRKRFSQILGALQLPTSKHGSSRPFDLGSLRPGGATWLLHQVEDPEYVRRRGRWLSSRTMEIYLQEVMVTTFIERLTPKARFLIELCSGSYALAVERAISFLDSGIPTKAWFSLLQAASVPQKNTGKVGNDGEVFRGHKTTLGSWHDDPSQQKSKKSESEIPDHRNSIDGLRCSSLPPRPPVAAWRVKFFEATRPL